MLTLSDTIAAIAELDRQAADIIAALDVHIAAETDHQKRGGLARIRTSLVDFVHALRQARQQFAGAARHCAAHGLAETAALVREVMADMSSADPNRPALDRIVTKTAAAKRVVTAT